MLGQVKNNKGFNLLELIVVIAIVGFISAISYPNFSSWNKERKIRAAVKDGMITMTKSLEELVKAGKIDAGAGKEH